MNPPNQPNSPKIIGLSGSFAGGKDTLARYLVEHFGYVHYSTGDMVREEAQHQRGSIERPVLHEVANRMRYTQGAGYFAEKALDKLQEHPDAAGIVVSGLRTLGEAKVIRQAGGSLVFVDAPLEIRYQRMLSRQRDSEAQKTLQEFKAGEQQEWYAGDNDEDFNLGGVKAMADVVLDNGDGLESFLREALQALGLDGTPEDV